MLLPRLFGSIRSGTVATSAKGEAGMHESDLGAPEVGPEPEGADEYAVPSPRAGFGDDLPDDFDIHDSSAFGVAERGFGDDKP